MSTNLIAKIQSLYLEDPYAWSMHQAEALRRRDFADVDWENVIEEIEDVGRRYVDRLRDHYSGILHHFLRIQYGACSDSELQQLGSIVMYLRGNVVQVLDCNPGLKSQRDPLFRKAWKLARDRAVAMFPYYDDVSIANPQQCRPEYKRRRREWNSRLPERNPYTRRQVEDPDWWPARPAASEG